MEFEKNITIDKKEFELIDVQRSRLSAIYRGTGNYLRIGDAEKITKDLRFHKQMESFGFPVARLIAEGTYSRMPYFIEESLGEECFGIIFKKETEFSGKVTDDSFNQYLDIVLKFTEAQLKTISSNKNWLEFQEGILLYKICEELPDEKDKILLAYKDAEKHLNDFPFGIQHGDFSPFNIYPRGVIDLEDSFQGPIAYDVGSILQSPNWFPDVSDDQFHKVWKFTNEQKSKLSFALDNLYKQNGLPAVSAYSQCFNLTKGIWFAVGISDLPQLQKFRYDLLKSMLRDT